MLKKTIKYEDYDGVEREEDFYFNLNKAEIFELQTTTEGGYNERIEKAVKAHDMVTVMKLFKDIILRTVGKKSDDGKRFIKSKEIADEFEQSPAYPILFMELATDANAAKEFMSGIIPNLTPEQKAEVEKEMAKLEAGK